jgi:purine-binding chemotaxis protein CheW
MMSHDDAPTADEQRRILRERARRFASRAETADGSGSIEVLEFGLAGERYAIEAVHVDDVVPLRELTPLPCTPDFLRGVVNVRGRLVGVIDLKKFFGLPERGITDLHRVVLLRSADLEFGLLADTVEGVVSLELEAIQPPLPTLTGIRETYVRGVTFERVLFLDAEAILSDRRLVVDEEVEP